MGFQLQLGTKIASLFGHTKASNEIIYELEELLIAADFGIEFTTQIIAELKEKRLPPDEHLWISNLRQILTDKMVSINQLEKDLHQVVWLVFGVNGTGKTTTVGKLAFRLKQEGKRVLIAAADTYRDAAIDQLLVWARRADVPIVRQKQGADPAAVVYDACDAALSRNVNALIVDTAGRLHNKERLMEELAKIVRVTTQKIPASQVRKILTLDATTGQNALSQAELFSRYAGVDGIVLTKLDSSAKGGIACVISWKLRVPILYIGTGETLKDLEPFDVDRYLDYLFS